MTTKLQVHSFLDQFKKAWANNGPAFVPRKKNLNGLAALALSVKDAEEAIAWITETAYVFGPNSDDDGSPGEVWGFGIDIEGTEVYIKLKYHEGVGKCLSFHPSESELSYPFR
jgi:hypothetical protein